MKNLKKILKKQGFTLVELIIVIAIIAVLAVAAFMMLTKWLGKSRDSRRMADLGTIKKALEITYSDTDNGVNMYPLPTTNNKVQDSDTNDMWNLGVFGLDTIGNMDNMQKAPQDPSFQTYYKYAVTLNQKEFQVGTMLENGSEVSFVANAFAAGETALVDGNYDGYVSYPSAGGTTILKTPSLLLYSGASLNSLTGDSGNFMVSGKSEGEIISLRNIETTESTTSSEIATALEIGKKDAEIVLKKEVGISSSDGSSSEPVIINSYGNCTEKGQIFESDLTYGNCDTKDIIICSGEGTGFTLAACNVGTNVAGSKDTPTSYGRYFQFGKSDDSFTSYVGSDWVTEPTGSNGGSANYWGVTEETKFTATYANSTAENQTKMQGPCTDGYHVPTFLEWKDTINSLQNLRDKPTRDGAAVAEALMIPYGGYYDFFNNPDGTAGTRGRFWTSSPNSLYSIVAVAFDTNITPRDTSVSSNSRAQRLPVRCFKNE